MLKKNLLTLLSALMLCAYSCVPVLANSYSDTSSFQTQYLAQNDQSESEEQGENDEGVQNEEAGQQSESTESTEESASASTESSSSGPFSSLISLLMGEGGGQPVSLATLFVQWVGMGILIVILVSIPISFTCVFCALIWKIGMVARGGKKPSIG